jgi:IPT/TIG domain-containing protein
MRKLTLLILLTLSFVPVYAADTRQPEAPDALLHRALNGLVAENVAKIVTDAQPAPLAAKTFNIVASSGSTASSFVFTVTPSPFVVNQGDMVTLNISVPSNDQSTGGHGFLLENYAESGIAIARGHSQTISFVANVPGQFTYICTVSTCGVGHTNMNGTFSVNAVQAPPPTISSINPATGATGGGNIVTITGTNFANGATVKFGSTSALGVSVNGTTSITATAPAHAAGSVTVTVTNPDGQSGTTNYVYADPTLSITAVSPNTGSTTGGTAVTITGSNFQSGATVTFGALPATEVAFVNSTTLTAKTPMGPVTQQLSVDVTVKNPDAKSATSTGAFTYTVPSPTVTDVSPSSSSTAGGTIVIISGGGFTNALASSVTFGGVAATNVTIVNPVTLIAVAPAHAAGGADVVVHIGANSGTKTGGFTYVTPSSQPRKRAVRH